MYNSDTPLRAELPSSKQLLRSTILAVIAALVLLIAVVLPAEYGIDPTGAGRVLRLTEMGDIKQQLAADAAADAAAAAPAALSPATGTAGMATSSAVEPPARAAAASAAASAASCCLISPISVRRRTRPAPVGSMPYSDRKSVV